MATITGLTVRDIRIPTSDSLTGSDAMNPDPDYSAAYVELQTDHPDGLAGHGLAFTIGRGNELCAAAVEAWKPFVIGLDLDDIRADMRAFWRRPAQPGWTPVSSRDWARAWSLTDRRKRPLRFWNIILRHTPQMRLRRSSISISATRTFIHAVSKKAASFSVFSSRPRRMKHAGSAPGPFLRRWRLIRPDNGGHLGPIRHPTDPPARPLLPRGRLKTASLLQGRLLGLRAGACL